MVKRSVPVSSYYFGPPPVDSAYFTPPMGQIGLHHPREIVRVERDYSGGEIVQFASTYPLEFEGRVSIALIHPGVRHFIFSKHSHTDHAHAIFGKYQCYQRDPHICVQPVAFCD